MSEVSTGHSTVTDIYGRGRTERKDGFVILRYTTECNECSQLHIEDCLYEDRVESEGNGGVQSISFESSNDQNDGSEYAGSLLDKILNQNNMNRAYERVKSNKGSRGSHGIDGMTVNEFLQYLKKWRPNQAVYLGGYV